MTNGILDSGQKIVTDGLVLNYDVAQLRSYPTTGTSIIDLSGNSNTGTLVNGVDFDSGSGGSLIFDGVNDYVNCGNSALLNSSNITFIAWVKRTVTWSNSPSLFWAKPNGVFNGNGFYIELAVSSFIGGGFSPTAVITNGAANNYFRNSINSNTSFALNTWVMFAFTLNVNTPAMYFNGVASSLTIGGTNAITATTTDKYLMSNSPNYNLYTNANIGQIKIYNRALSATEVLQNFNANKSRYGL